MLKEKLQAILDEALAKIEVVAEDMVEAHSDAMVEEILKELALKIPGQLDDMLLAALKETIKAIVKAQLKKYAEMISKA